MKKLFLAVAIFLFGIINSSAQEWIGVDKSIPVKIQESLVLSSEEEIIVDVKVGGFFQNEVKYIIGNKGKSALFRANIVLKNILYLWRTC